MWQVSTVHQVTKSKLTLCDLAGSEDVRRSGATGMALAEAKKINTSLLALGDMPNVTRRYQALQGVTRRFNQTRKVTA